MQTSFHGSVQISFHNSLHNSLHSSLHGSLHSFKTILKLTAAASALALAGHASAAVTFYQNDNFQGPSFTTSRQIGNLERFGFNDRASSVSVDAGQRWEVCDAPRFAGRCAVLRPGRYASLATMGLNNRVTSVRALDSNARIDENRYAPLPVVVGASGPGVASRIVLFEREGFQGQSFTSENQVDDFGRFGFNDRASSAVVLGERWEACDNTGFGGSCVVLRPGRYPSLAAMGMGDRVSSVRALDQNVRVDDNRYAPQPILAYDNRRQNNEVLYAAKVTSVRAVVKAAEQRCWVERQPVAQARPAPNIGAGLVGALIGGVLGHQVGGGTGKDIATVGGAVAGAAIGANVGRNAAGQPVAGPDIQRCETLPVQASQTNPEFWDVTYTFRGVSHQVQMTSAPGPTISVNAQGEPRV